MNTLCIKHSKAMKSRPVHFFENFATYTELFILR